MPMFCRLPNPDWLPDVQAIFTSTQAETKLGCGGCAHAEWVGCESETNFSGARLYFDVAICRSGIPIVNGEPRKYCTAFQGSVSGTPLNSVPFSNSGGVPISRHRPEFK